jgi:hypothetical protein
LQEDTQDLLATVAAASTGQQQQQQEQQPAPELDQPNVQQQQQQPPAGTPASSSVEQAIAWQEEEGDNETEAGLPDGLVLVRLQSSYYCWLYQETQFEKQPTRRPAIWQQ